jgi:hypothetical protein
MRVSRKVFDNSLTLPHCRAMENEVDPLPQNTVSGIGVLKLQTSAIRRIVNALREIAPEQHDYILRFAKEELAK